MGIERIMGKYGVRFMNLSGFGKIVMRNRICASTKKCLLFLFLKGEMRSLNVSHGSYERETNARKISRWYMPGRKL